ncbi:probable protein phosphatase 2C 8 isoform X2 [Malania oleifera]|uniref:probable protein phosphatase 2C 8 isoform X2 n=1 Tax=Malania oleifera TaxID=397392 RepID=UPI0025AE6AB2|nr:probable protein phosphatase 2C 8 isoform X2 [Malania oleifera]XP_057952716.1 probable protein phosphatase 2C 8 isoform X2 [Malania oleifera]
MADEPNSVRANEKNLECNNCKKREGEFEDFDLNLKKSRAKAVSVENVEKAEETLNALDPAGGQVDHISDVSNDGAKDFRVCNQNGSSDGTRGVREMGFVIEADAAEDKGSRHTMEDAWVLLPDASLEFPGKLRCAHFAIYDGHGGRLAAEYAQKHLHLDVKAAKKAIVDGFRITDKSLIQESTAGGWQDGATAVCVWILGQTVFVANIGDAKAVVAQLPNADGLWKHEDHVKSLKAIVLTREHKAIYPQERARIQKAGGVVGSNGRLQGRLEVSRAFGDRQFKKFGVVAIPDVHSFDLTDRECFVILGCDGLWGVFGPSDAVDFVQKMLIEGLPVSTVSHRLVREAVRERRCKDNCTAVVIVFKRM